MIALKAGSEAPRRLWSLWDVMNILRADNLMLYTLMFGDMEQYGRIHRSSPHWYYLERLYCKVFRREPMYFRYRDAIVRNLKDIDAICQDLDLYASRAATQRIFFSKNGQRLS